MALVEFENNSPPYLNADNLNNNFSELETKIDTTTTQLTNLQSYSTTETVIGTWNNKPLYRKVYTKTTTVNTYNYIYGMPSNIKDIVHIYGTNKQASGNFTALPYYFNSGDYANVYYSLSSNALVVATGSSYGHGEAIVVIEYTKTTD